ncbi:hypothetical protein, partial [Intestinirhabdus alba]|uniref:hypothetical protein n=1 Tax=Intestinirhabdus alba TaxID=2899544 RepID=UPI001AE09670
HRVGYKMNAADPVQSAFATAEVLSSSTLISATSLRRSMEGSTLNICAGRVTLGNACGVSFLSLLTTQRFINRIFCGHARHPARGYSFVRYITILFI